MFIGLKLMTETYFIDILTDKGPSLHTATRENHPELVLIDVSKTRPS